MMDLRNSWKATISFLFFLKVLVFEVNTSSPSTLIILEIGNCCSCPTWPGPWCFYFMLLPSLRWQMHATTSSILLLRWGLAKFLTQDWPGNHDLPIPHSHIVWDDRHIPHHPAINWDEALWTPWRDWPQMTILTISVS
jgi:hypothetical protein